MKKHHLHHHEGYSSRWDIREVDVMICAVSSSIPICL
eukprot:CAMPEP_0116026574 /NCGR_PEP_ID=MMETSP0321-20121206/13953_1 /TAXON_ID=163516 /ORGANISM="Leptocylindrus danicus var. danicus, Strain B650" /LENGTH=36 /DNA_ID= /DNA_START= /DNA_END= /DNA_ORIENTATION=